MTTTLVPDRRFAQLVVSYAEKISRKTSGTRVDDNCYVKNICRRLFIPEKRMALEENR